MSDIIHNCLKCKAVLRVPESMSGTMSMCPLCETQFQVPIQSKPQLQQIHIVPPPISEWYDHSLNQAQESAPTVRPKTRMGTQACCPKCGSVSISAVQSGYDASLGCLGTLLYGPLGLLCGGIKADEVFCVCLKCGAKWRIK